VLQETANYKIHVKHIKNKPNILTLQFLLHDKPVLGTSILLAVYEYDINVLTERRKHKMKILGLDQ
jgi:hypothetical protein